MARTCKNCRVTVGVIIFRWCDDCWRAAFKASAATLGAAIGSVLATRYLAPLAGELWRRLF